MIGKRSKIIYATVSGNGGNVLWNTPIFADNVGVTKVISNLQSGSSFLPHEYNVFYAARDESNNRMKFAFKLIVRGKLRIQYTVMLRISARALILTF